jgi:LmbE family N-acetylglucosaminyl deacetylase
MLGLNLDLQPGRDAHVLVLGAHSDDIEIGAGGAIRRLLQTLPGARVRWVVLAASGEREAEATRSARSILGPDAKHTVQTFAFRDGFFPYDGGQVKEAFEDIKAAGNPDVVFTHQRDDLHQDHRIVGELTWNTFRNHLILEYEIPKYDGGLGSPSFFVPLPTDVVDAKVQGLMAHFGTQRSKRWFSEETFRGLMRLRGIECQSESGYAEAFYCRKVVLQSGGKQGA